MTDHKFLTRHLAVQNITSLTPRRGHKEFMYEPMGRLYVRVLLCAPVLYNVSV